LKQWHGSALQSGKSKVKPLYRRFILLWVDLLGPFKPNEDANAQLQKMYATLGVTALAHASGYLTGSENISFNPAPSTINRHLLASGLPRAISFATSS
jgi:hypothetical protein